MNETELRAFLGDIDIVAQTSEVTTDPIEVSPDINITEIRAFLNNA